MATLFDEIVLRRPKVDNRPVMRPLWKIKLSDAEFEELRSFLLMGVKRMEPDWFEKYPRECLLFFAEYWKRYFDGGKHSVKKVLDCLAIGLDKDYEKSFYGAALKGAEKLRIEIFKGDRNEQKLDSIFYQGGLPLNSIFKSDGKTNWTAFIKGMVVRRLDFDQINMGIVARSNTGLREFCRALCNAIDKKQYRLLPFYCESESDPRYIYLVDQFNQPPKGRASRPFSINWTIDLNSLDEKMTIKYLFSGPQTLKSKFLESHGVAKDFFTVQLKCDSSVVQSFDYIDNFCHSEVSRRNIYHSTEIIDVWIDDEKQILTSSLDLSTPHLMYQTEDGRYVLGNRLGTFESAIIVPDGWEIENPSLYTIKRYMWERQEYKGILIPPDWTEDIVLSGPDGQLTFGSNRRLYWTEITGAPLSLPNIRETVYDASKVNFCLCSDEEEEDKSVITDNVKFRNKWSDEWLTTPPIGKIFYKAESPETNYVQSDKFINVGGQLSITILHADSDSCRIKVSWPKGKVFPRHGQLLDNGGWLIKKKDCVGTTYDIPIEFTPYENPQNAFILTLKAPFKDFYIVDEEGNRIGSDVWLPFTDLDRFRYHIAGIDNIKLTVGENQYRLRCIGEKLCLYNGEQSRKVPYEGPLIHLLGSREEIRSMLDKTSENMINSQIEALFQLPEGKRLRFYIKESPYRPWQKGNEIIIRGKNKVPIDYRRALRLYRLDDPTQTSVTVEYNPEHGYLLPESIKDWGKAIVTGRTRGRICPTMVEYDRDYSSDERRKSRVEAIRSISASIANSTFADATWTRIIDWFNLSQKEDLPASSFLDLVCVARNAESLIKLAFHLYCEGDGEEELKLLIRKMKYFSADLAFQWYWVLPFMNNIGLALSRFITDLKCPAIMRMYFRWAQTMKNPVEYILAASSEQYYEYCPILLQGKIEGFCEWLNCLCMESMNDSYSGLQGEGTELLIENIINNEPIRDESHSYRAIHINQSDLIDCTRSFFSRNNEEKYSTNENWLMSRVKTVSRHLKGQIDLFDELKLTQETSKCPCQEGRRLGCSQAEESRLQEAMDKADRIRRSIIFCYKSAQPDFVFQLNNLLAR